jgi:hypothetical protein
MIEIRKIITMREAIFSELGVAASRRRSPSQERSGIMREATGADSRSCPPSPGEPVRPRILRITQPTRGVMADVTQRVLDIAGGLANASRAAARAAIRTANPKLGALITLATPLLGDELQQPIECASMPTRLTEPGELVRIHLNFAGGIASHDDLAHLLIREIEPFIIGVGQVKVRLAAQGTVIISRADLGEIDRGH